MSEDKVKAFLTKLDAEEAMQSRLDAELAQGSDKVETFVRFAAKEGFHFQPAELARGLGASELSDGELEGVAGGIIVPRQLPAVQTTKKYGSVVCPPNS